MRQLVLAVKDLVLQILHDGVHIHICFVCLSSDNGAGHTPLRLQTTCIICFDAPIPDGGACYFQKGSKSMEMIDTEAVFILK